MSDRTHPPVSAAPEEFVRRLSALGDSERRALRRAVGQPLGADVLVYDIFCKVFRPVRRKEAMPKWACYLVATLYPWHSADGGHGNFGTAMRQLRPRTAPRENRKRAAANRKRADQRFTRLLDCTGPVLSAELTAAVRALRRNDVPVSWAQLLDDLCRWYAPDRCTQSAWAESYFKS